MREQALYLQPPQILGEQAYLQVPLDLHDDGPVEAEAQAEQTKLIPRWIAVELGHRPVVDYVRQRAPRYGIAYGVLAAAAAGMSAAAAARVRALQPGNALDVPRAELLHSRPCHGGVRRALVLDGVVDQLPKLVAQRGDPAKEGRRDRVPPGEEGVLGGHVDWHDARDVFHARQVQHVLMALQKRGLLLAGRRQQVVHAPPQGHPGDEARLFADVGEGPEQEGLHQRQEDVVRILVRVGGARDVAHAGDALLHDPRDRGL